MRTFRRLNDGARYYGLTWQGWLALGLAASVLYAAVRVSPLGYRPTVTITLFALAAASMVLYALSGQALGPARYVAAFLRWRYGPAYFVVPDATTPVTGGVLVDALPLVLAGRADQGAWWPDNETREPARTDARGARSVRLP